ncbi:VOC family protein [Paenibacillus alkalitolerans]|uniref:VOC family protein n=1 Tax=Paenibacillus alkalitolerans TaxID=2799335 RepID=UPI002D7F1B49|nr:VOC family protein [Paenibacillus alkalitolerans]
MSLFNDQFSERLRQNSMAMEQDGVINAQACIKRRGGVKMYDGLHHVAVAVTDLEKAKHFYGEILGLQESGERPNFPFPGAWYRIGGNQLHLIVHPEARTVRGTARIDSMDGHFAIRVKDMNTVLKRLNDCGWAYDDRPKSITGWHQVFVTDPDGNVIELNAEIDRRR